MENADPKTTRIVRWWHSPIGAMTAPQAETATPSWDAAMLQHHSRHSRTCGWRDALVVLSVVLAVALA